MKNKTKKQTSGISKTGARLLLLTAFACIVAGAFGQQGQSTKGPEAGDQFTPLIRSVSGPELFQAYCASCHGLDGKGRGPAAAALKTKVPDLTLLAMNDRGKFPTERVRQTITGEVVVAVHGSREMPIWGPIFHQVEEDVDRGHIRVQNLVEYIQSIQAMPVAKSPSPGAQLYKQLCAACHANDLKGSGPAPYPFKDVPPDLTTLAQRHGGKFPDAYVSEVLRNGVIMPAHGPAEMPIWGVDFQATGLNGAQVAQRIADLTSYLKSRQAE